MTLKPLPSVIQERVLAQRQHFQVVAPVATHRVEATCREVDCTHYIDGWQTVVPKGSEQELYLDRLKDRKYVKRIDGESAVFMFYPEQRCFRRHTKPLFRPPILMHRREWDGQRRVLSFNQWHDEFATTLEDFRRERG